MLIGGYLMPGLARLWRSMLKTSFSTLQVNSLEGRPSKAIVLSKKSSPRHHDSLSQFDSARSFIEN